MQKAIESGCRMYDENVAVHALLCAWQVLFDSGSYLQKAETVDMVESPGETTEDGEVQCY